MKIQSFFSAYILFLLLAISTSCGEQCTAPDLDENIIGNWRMTVTGNMIEFRADGTLIDPNAALIGGQMGGVVLDQKSFEVLGADLIKVRAESGSEFLELEYAVPSNFCDELRIIAFNGEITLIRQ